VLKTELIGSLYSLLNVPNVIRAVEGSWKWVVDIKIGDPKIINVEFLFAVLKIAGDPELKIPVALKSLQFPQVPCYSVKSFSFISCS
jgi:hypothetical protein